MKVAVSPTDKPTEFIVDISNIDAYRTRVTLSMEIGPIERIDSVVDQIMVELSPLLKHKIKTTLTKGIQPKCSCEGFRVPIDCPIHGGNRG